MTQQLPLGFLPAESANFDTFVPAGNDQLLAHLQNMVNQNPGDFIYLWGVEGSGKSHLLQAACQLSDRRGAAPAYIPLKEASALSPSMLDGLEQMALVCLDDIHTIGTDPLWEEALFHLFNRIRENGGKLLASADCSPSQLNIELSDLHSRLSWGTSYQLQPLGDREKRLILMESAARRGLELNHDTADYILRHAPRDLASLLQLMERLDRESLAAQRRLTIPFIRQFL
ncbi:MAG: DnaA regulatory inactivator Hda [Gammaproteobacteria bacterium]|nr:DnaA regulatory inactivator Hda [Gammaproteobacteria bacterium]